MSIHIPTSITYGVVLLVLAIAYYLLQKAIISAEGDASFLKRAMGRDIKGKFSPEFYIVDIG